MSYSILKQKDNLFNFIKKEGKKYTRKGEDIKPIFNSIIEDYNPKKITFKNITNCYGFFGVPNFKFGDFVQVYDGTIKGEITDENLLMDTSNVKNFNSFCAHCGITIFKPKIDYSSAETMEDAFYSCLNLKEIGEINSINCKNFKNTFCDCLNLQILPFVNTDKCEDFTQTFADCSKLLSINVSSFKKGRTFQGTFGGCKSLVEIDLRNETNNGESFYGIFETCENLETIKGLDLQNSKNNGMAFKGCYKLKNLDIKNITPKGVVNFRDCYNLTEESIIQIVKELYTNTKYPYLKATIVFNENYNDFLNNTYCKIIDNSNLKKTMELVESDTDSAISLVNYIKKKDWGIEFDYAHIYG